MKKLVKIVCLLLLIMLPLLVSCSAFNNDLLGRYYEYDYFGNKDKSDYIELCDNDVLYIVNESYFKKGDYIIEGNTIILKVYDNEYQGRILEGTVIDGSIVFDNGSSIYSKDGKYNPNLQKPLF